MGKRDQKGSKGIKRDQKGSKGIKRDQKGSKGIKIASGRLSQECMHFSLKKFYYFCG